MQNNYILIVDDEPDICQILKYNFEKNGFIAHTASSAENAIKTNLKLYNIMLFDIMMDKMDGFELLKYVREKLNLNTPVLFLSALNQPVNIIKGFDYGADDFIKKPFIINEVIARVNAVLKRYNNQQNKLPENTIYIDNNFKQLHINNNVINLTPTEYDIFMLLYKHPGKVHARADILKQIWLNQPNVLGRTVDVNITRIRNKLGKFSNCIITRPGYGYYFDSSVFKNNY